MKTWLFCIAIALVLFNNARVKSQTCYSPISGITAGNFSSAFGPRNVTSNNAEYPNQGYDYDFHAAIDIASAAGTAVKPIADGTVKAYSTATFPNYYVEVDHRYQDQTTFLVRYYHIQPATDIVYAIDHHQTYTVTGGVTTLGSILEDHLDIRYYPDGSRQDLDKNADNPGKILTGVSGNTFSSSIPVFVDRNGFAITSTTIYTEKDDRTDFGNPAGAEYFTAGVRIDRTALSIHGVQVWMTAVDGVNWYYNEQLLDNAKNDPKTPEYGTPDLVWYYSDDQWLRQNFPDRWRISCGDLVSNDDDNGHVSKTVGIYPRKLDTQNGTHTVYFRWYINVPLCAQLKNRNVPIYVDFISDSWDQDCIAEIDNIQVSTCIDCPHPTGVPDAPSLTNANYDPQGLVKLQWIQSGNNSPQFYKIYRCLASRDMTDLDVVGISATTGYADSDLRLQPGFEYKYAVAGVNEKGEGPNSKKPIGTGGVPEYSMEDQAAISAATTSPVLNGGSEPSGERLRMPEHITGG